MAGITQTIPNYILGISEQPDELKSAGQVVDLKNGFPDITDGLKKRPGGKVTIKVRAKAAEESFPEERKVSDADRKSKQKQIGFIAQEVEEVFPSLVSEYDIAPGNPNDSDHVPVMKKAIKQAWDPIIIKALQEAIAKIETLETKVAALEAA